MHSPLTRRRFLAHTAATGLSAATTSLLSRLPGATPVRASAPKLLFDGKTLNGWRAVPRLSVPRDARFASIPPDELRAAVIKWYEERPQQNAARLRHVGRWEVVDGAIVGGHEPPDSLYGAYLLTEAKFADFELELEARPDWPVDTGIMLRAHELGIIGFQVLLDHRPKGGIGGVYGNSIGSFLVAPVAVNGDKLPGFRVANLRAGQPEGNFTRVTPSFGATFEDFQKVWRGNDWNRFRIRCVGRLPVITTWINGTKICELDTATIQAKGYDAEDVARRLGRAGHIGFEVHDVDPKGPLGMDRWAPGAVCRWRKISIIEL
jgi:hypothetical protein